MINFKISVRALLFFITTLILIFTGSLFSGKIFFAAFFFLCLLFAYSLVQFFLTILHFKHHQIFSTIHPVKGESVQFDVDSVNESVLPSARVGLRFKITTPLRDRDPYWENFVLESDVRKRMTNHIRCPYRGIYEIGVETIHYSDLLGFVNYSNKANPQTFYVYPRLLEIEFNPRFLESSGLLRSREKHALDDQSIFRSIDPYRNGESVKNAYWKKFFTTGNLFVKTPENSVNPGIDILVDLHHTEFGNRSQQLESEDLSVEAGLALARYCISQFIPCTIHAFKSGHQQWHINNYADLDFFRKKSLVLGYTEAGDLVLQTNILYENNLIQGSTLVIVTHDIQGSLGLNPSISDLHFILNTVHQEKKKIENIKHRVAEKKLQDRFLYIQSEATFKEDLER